MLESVAAVQETDKVVSTSPSPILRIIKEPLLHFILTGAAIYLMFTWFGRTESEEVVAIGSIVITEGEMVWLAGAWRKRWNRPPTNEEMLGLVRQHLRETVLYREAMSMGLDRDDTIVRRRLAQKLEFLSQGLVQPEPPSEEQLKKYFEDNIDRYRMPRQITFTHVFLDPDKRGDQTLMDAEALKAKLIAEATVPMESCDLDDSLMLQGYYPERSEADISKLFGSEFVKLTIKLEPEKWHGPVLSGYGTHLVYVHALQEFPTPIFEQVAGRVAEDWETGKWQELNAEYIESFLKRYEVVMEGKDGETGKAILMEVTQ